MNHPAHNLNYPDQNPKKQVLITNVGSFLGSFLAKSLIAQNCEVYGIGSSPLLSDLLGSPGFTLLEIDLTQPLPSFLPSFNLIFYLDLLKVEFQKEKLFDRKLPHSAANILFLAKENHSKLFVCIPISTDPSFQEYLISTLDDPQISVQIFQIGDLYGPGMPFLQHKTQPPTYQHDPQELTSLITQATKSDKIVLENEGLKIIYPAYIADVVYAINKFTFSNDSKKVHCLVSQEPLTTLSVAYEIQKVWALVSGNQLNLFFKGQEPHLASPEPLVKIDKPSYSPKFKLEDGLKKTFEYFQSRTQASIINNQIPPQAFLVDTKSSPQKPKISFLKPNRHLITAKIPKVSVNLKFKGRLKFVIILLVLAAITTIGKTALDIYLGTKSITSAKEAFLENNFEEAKIKAKTAHKSYQSALNKVKIATFPLSLISDKKIKTVNLTLESASLGSSSLVYFIEASQVLVDNLSKITSQNSKGESLDLETPLANLRKSHLFSSQALEMAKQAKSMNLFQSNIESLISSTTQLKEASISALELTSLTPHLIAESQDRIYLILLQNNAELRPGGGFIGNFGLIQFENGKLQEISVEDIYNIDGQLKEEIEPPKQIKEKLGVDRLFLRDSNWSPDFILNSQTARDFFKKETGKDVNGVIAIDLTLIQDLLSKIGAIDVPEYNETITADNLFEKGEYYSEIGFFPGSTQKKDFFGALTQALISKILTSLNHQSNQNQNVLPGLIEVAKQGLSKKHILLSFDDQNLASFVRTKGWDNPLPPLAFNPRDDSTETRDFLALSEANLGANKVNRFIERKISYEMTIGRDADLVANLKITYTNNSQAETWPAGKYVNYLRVYVPFAAGLEDFSLSIPPEVKPSPSPSTRRSTDQPVSPRDDNVIDKNDVEVTTQGNLAVFSTYVEVPINSTQEVTFTYRIPKNIKLETAPTYHLYVQKQPGTEKDPLQFRFNLPAYLAVEKVNGEENYSGQQNITIDSDLSRDREFEVEINKK